MKKFYVFVAVFFSFLVFCTTDNSTNPTGAVAKSEYTDSIVIDLYAYSVWCLQHNTAYFGPLKFTSKGQSLLKAPLDSGLMSYNSGSTTSPIFAPKYPPSKFEAVVYDSMPLVDSDSLSPQLLVQSFSSSRYYNYCLDTTPVSDSTINLEKCISRPNVIYLYGLGFNIDYFLKWGLGKIKIYYK